MVGRSRGQDRELRSSRRGALPGRGTKSALTVAAVGRAGDAGASEHFEDPAYYDRAYRKRRADVDFYARLADAARGPVLEYGVGTGRVALVVARGGAHVTGVDRSAPMLAAFREKLRREPEDVRRRIRLVRGDMRSVQVGRRFRLVIAPFNAILHLYTRHDIERFLQNVRRHLTRGGRFVFDFSLPRSENLGADPTRRYGVPRFRYPGIAPLVRYGERFEYDPFRQVLLVNMEFEPEDGSTPWTVALAHRQFFPQEMEALLHYNGFSDLRWYPDFTDGPVHADTDFIAVSVRARR